MISVCMATYNGAKYIDEQISSILNQLSDNDELIISDDNSTDDTINIIKSYNDKRIKLIINTGKNGIIYNFENAINHSSGEIIFLSDQDDVWCPNKITTCLMYLKTFKTVVSDCLIVDNVLNIIQDSMFKLNPPKNGIINNLIKNHFQGSCMAFHKDILSLALPFPKNIAMHDLWLGICSEYIGHTAFIKEKLIKYRRHEFTVTHTFKSPLRLSHKILYRLYLIYVFVKRIIRKRLLS